MSTDGVKIIDSDTAHDTYWSIMDLYDNGVTIETIQARVPFPQPDYSDEFDYEIYTTAYALAVWEIGEMSEDILQEIKRVIDKGACVKTWREEHGIELGKKRQNELDKLWYKINAPNQKVRKRKKYKLIETFLFDINEVLAFQLEDNNYYVTILLNINQYRGVCTYEFGQILYKDVKIPTITDILSCEIIGRKIPSGTGIDITKILSLGMEEITKQGGIEEILQKEVERTGSYVLGMSKIGVDHRELINFSDKFLEIGKINLIEDCKGTGTMGSISSYGEFSQRYSNLSNSLKFSKERSFKIKELMKE